MTTTAVTAAGWNRWQKFLAVMLLVSAVIPLILATVQPPNAYFQTPDPFLLAVLAAAMLFSSSKAGNKWRNSLLFAVGTPIVCLCAAYAHFWAREWWGLTRLESTLYLVVGTLIGVALAYVAWLTSDFWWHRAAQVGQIGVRGVNWYQADRGFVWWFIRRILVPSAWFFAILATGGSPWIAGAVALMWFFIGRTTPPPPASTPAVPPTVPGPTVPPLPFVGGPAPVMPASPAATRTFRHGTGGPIGLRRPHRRPRPAAPATAPTVPIIVSVPPPPSTPSSPPLGGPKTRRTKLGPRP